jgi:hypothetical protein
MPQRPDVDQIKKAWALKREGGMSQQAMAEELGLHPRTVNNYFRSSWLAQRKLGHLRFASQEPQFPRSALENRAWEMCEAGEHSWMAEDLYKGHAYTESESTEEIDGFGGSTLRTIYADTTCHYCGLVRRRKRHRFLLV